MTIPKSINLGFLNIHLYGVVIATAILVAWWLAVKRAYLYKIPRQKLETTVLLIPLVLGILGGRLYHVADKWSYYSQNPIQAVRLDQGGLGIWGAIVGIILGFYIVARIQKINLLSVLDLIAPSLLLAQGIGRIGNYVNQEGFGPPTSLPWGVMINGGRVHPTFFYEMWLDFIFFAVLLAYERKLARSGQLSNVKGRVFGLYLISYGAIRIIVEAFRIDTWTVGQFHMAYLFSAVSIVAGCLLFLKAKNPINNRPGAKRGPQGTVYQR